METELRTGVSVSFCCDRPRPVDLAAYLGRFNVTGRMAATYAVTSLEMLRAQTLNLELDSALSWEVVASGFLWNAVALPPPAVSPRIRWTLTQRQLSGNSFCPQVERGDPPCYVVWHLLAYC